MTLVAAVYVVVRPLLMLLARTVDPSWFPTVRLGLECCVLAAIGWVVGRVRLAVMVFAITLVASGFGQAVEIRIPWLLQLALDATRDRHYWDSLLDTAIIQAFLFSSLFIGARLSRRAPIVPASIWNHTEP